MRVYPALERFAEPGEVVTAECMVGRLMDRGYRRIPTTGSIANALGKSPMFDRLWDGNRKKRLYLRRHNRRRAK